MAVAAPSVPAWDEGYAGGNVGGLLGAMLQPTKGFGKFLTVLLSLSVAGNITATFYSMTLNIQVFIPPLVVVPRYVFSLAATGVFVSSSSAQLCQTHGHIIVLFLFRLLGHIGSMMRL